MMSHGAWLRMQPISEVDQVKKHTITVTKRSGDFMAYLDGDTRMWGCGVSPGAAIGYLVLGHAEALGIELKSEEPK